MEAYFVDIVLPCLAIIFATSVGWYLGKMDERENWNKLITIGVIPKPRKG